MAKDEGIKIPITLGMDEAFREGVATADHWMRILRGKIEARPLDLKIDVAGLKMSMQEIMDLADGVSNSIAKATKENKLKGLITPEVALNSLIVALNEYAKATAESGGATRQQIEDVNQLAYTIGYLKTKIDGGTQTLEMFSDASIANAKKQQEAEENLEKALYGYATTLDKMQAKLRAWQTEQAKSEVGSERWKEASIEIQNVEESIKKATLAAKNFGLESTSINAITAQMAELEGQWAALSERDRKGKVGKNIQEEYEKLYRKELKTLRDITVETDKRNAKEKDLLNTTRSIEALTKRIAILREKLNKTEFGSAEWSTLNEQLSEAQKQLSSISAQVGNTGSKANATLKKVNEGLRIQDSYLGRVLIRMAAYSSVFALGRMLRSIREVTAEFELQKVALGSILQDQGRATALFNQIKAAAVKSPFEIKDLVAYTKQMAAYQVAEEDLFETTMRLADVSAGLGVDMQRLILAYGQVKSATVLRGQELRQFTEAGIPIIKQLADKFTELRGTVVSTAEVFDLVTKRAVSFEMVKEVFEDMTEAGGTFYKMQEKQAETLAGKWANLKDAVSIAYDEMGRSTTVNTGIELVVKTITGMANSWQKIVNVLEKTAVVLIAVKIAQKNASIVLAASTAAVKEELFAEKLLLATQSKGIAVWRNRIALYVGEARAQKICAWQTYELATAMRNAEIAGTMWKKSLWSLYATMLENPFGIMIALVTGLSMALLSLSDRSKNATKNVSERMDDLEKAASAANELKKYIESNAKLINEYEKLGKTVNRTVSEQSRFVKVSNMLAKTFPDAVRGINEETKAVLLLTDKMRELNDAQDLMYKGSTAKFIKDNFDEQLKAMKSELEQRQKWVKDWTEKGLVNPMYKERKSDLGNFFFGWRKVKDEKEFKEGIVENIQLMIDLQKRIEAIENPTRQGSEALNELRQNFLTFKTDGGISLFLKGEVENFTSLKDAIDAAVKKYKEYDEVAKTIAKAMETVTDPKQLEVLKKDLQYSEALRDVAKSFLETYNALAELNGKKQPTDSFQKLISDQTKFIQDFKKSVDDLAKYTSRVDAIVKTRKIMEGRGKQLGYNVGLMTGSESDYLNSIDKLMSDAQKRIEKYGALKGKSLVEMLSYRTSDTELKSLIDELQKLWDVKTTFNTKAMEDNFKRSLARMSENVARAKEAKDFWKNIFGATASKDVADSLTYAIFGETGQELERRIEAQLKDAFKNISIENIVDKETKKKFASLYGGDAELKSRVDVAINNKDYVALRKYLDALDETSRNTANTIINNGINANAEWLKDMIATYGKVMSFADRIKVAKDTAKRDEEAILKSIATGETSQEFGSSLIQGVRTKEAKDIAQIQLEMLKTTDEWTKTFENLDRVSTSTIDSVIAMIDDYIANTNLAADTSERAVEILKTLTEEKNKLIAQKEERNPFQAIIDGVNQLKKVANEMEYTDNGDIIPESVDVDAFADGLNKITTGLKGVGDQLENMASFINQFADFIDSVGGKSAEGFAEGLRAAADGVSALAKGLALVTTAAIAFIAVSRVIVAGGLGVVLMAIAGAVAAIAATISAISNAKVRKMNKEIEAQQKKIEALERSYQKLGETMEKTFGSDYISAYNQQLDALQAKSEAYLAQAEAERGKGKKKDEDKIEEYMQSYQDTIDDIKKAQTQLAEHFAGTDLTSAARDFAESWIDAYAEFASTTEAMKEKFKDLIQNMIVESIAGKVMQDLLKPIFDTIDEYSQTGGALTAGEIAAIAKMTSDTIPQINDAMVNLMNQLAAAGYNVRSSASGLTGISKDIANASEESILGLAAGINTQNFYISQIHSSVLQILAILSGQGSVTQTAAQNAAASVASAASTDAYFSYLPTIADNTANAVKECQNILAEVKKVIVPKSSSGNGYKVMIS